MRVCSERLKQCSLCEAICQMNCSIGSLEKVYFTFCPIHEAVNYKLKRELSALQEQKRPRKRGKPKLGPVWPCVRF